MLSGRLRWPDDEHGRPDQVSPEPTAEEQLIQREAHATLTRLISELPSEYHEIARLYFVECEPVADIARALHLRSKVVAAMVDDARTRMRVRYDRR